jgi:hypothetical protein
VNEVDVEGNVVHLKGIGCHSQSLTSVDIQTVPQSEAKKEEEPVDLATLVGEEIASKFQLYLEKEKMEPNAKFIFPVWKPLNKITNTNRKMKTKNTELECIMLSSFYQRK